MRIVWREKALDDLECLRAHVARDDEDSAARVVLLLFDAIERLADHPGLGRPGRVARTRELVVTDTPYVVAYRVKDERVEILRVLHGARRWPSRLR